MSDQNSPDTNSPDSNPIDAELALFLKTGTLIYTDGACSGNPGPGGWGAIVVRPDGRVKELGAGEASTTNNQMEMLATILALREVRDDDAQVMICTDSTYVIRGITQWIWGWQKRGWKTASKEPVKNADLWKLLDEQVSRHTVKWQWVRGHIGHHGNERADQLSNRGVEEMRGNKHA